jgi:hypothetical protein
MGIGRGAGAGAAGVAVGKDGATTAVRGATGVGMTGGAITVPCGC